MKALTRVAIAPLRAEASDKAEIVSQLLFGDHVTVLGEEGNWWLVENAYDNYQGWADSKQFLEISEEAFQQIKPAFLAPLQFNNSLTAPDGTNYQLSACSTLPFFKDGQCLLGDKKFKVNFVPHQACKENFKDDVITHARFYLNTPYLWGGRSMLGIDCSGFVQNVFKFFGIHLRRDARQQAEEGQLVDFLSEGRPGDVAFFDNDEGKIIHVGIMVDNQHIIHASGRVKIDPIDNQGIFSQELGKYTHKLRIIKRFVE